jgi:hypothetical protein
MLDRWHEDALRIGRGDFGIRYLARRLAELGLSPAEKVEAEPVDAGETDRLAEEWRALAYREAERFYAERGFGKPAPRECRVLKFRPGHGHGRTQ